MPNVILIKHLKLSVKNTQKSLFLEVSDVPQELSPATFIPQKNTGNISKENDTPNYGKEFDSHHIWGSSCSMLPSRMSRKFSSSIFFLF